jgi:hypothetical protein
MVAAWDKNKLFDIGVWRERILAPVGHAGSQLRQNPVDVRGGCVRKNRWRVPTLASLGVVAGRIGVGPIVEMNADEAKPSRGRIWRREIDLGAVDAE